MTKTDYDPDRSLVLIEGLSHFLTHLWCVHNRLFNANFEEKLIPNICLGKNIEKCIQEENYLFERFVNIFGKIVNK
jgi:hypothetical protein